MLWVIAPLGGLGLLLLLGLWASLAASLARFRGGSRAGPGPLLPMTLIKPVRGLDEGLRENFESAARADPEGRLQVIIALESREDPAWGVARDFAAAHPGRDVLVLETGPAGGRMGKIHNMISALPKARHPYVIFSDADTAATPALLRETSSAFQAGEDAVFGLPYHESLPGLGGLLFQLAFNHFFCTGAALTYYLGDFRYCAGAWMAYSRRALERAGGLEPQAQAIADDFAISTAVGRAGARKHLLRELVPVRESDSSLRDVLAHLVKWAVIIRWSLPCLYALMPLGNLTLVSLAVWGACEASGSWMGWGRGLLACAAASRALVALLQDRLVGASRLPLPAYVLVPIADLGSAFFWLACAFKRTILWRGVRYRLNPGGRAEVL